MRNRSIRNLSVEGFGEWIDGKDVGLRHPLLGMANPGVAFASRTGGTRRGGSTTGRKTTGRAGGAKSSAALRRSHATRSAEGGKANQASESAPTAGGRRTKV